VRRHPVTANNDGTAHRERAGDDPKEIFRTFPSQVDGFDGEGGLIDDLPLQWRVIRRKLRVLSRVLV
jgi:hypothetical protein